MRCSYQDEGWGNQILTTISTFSLSVCLNTLSILCSHFNAASLPFISIFISEQFFLTASVYTIYKTHTTLLATSSLSDTVDFHVLAAKVPSDFVHARRLL